MAARVRVVPVVMAATLLSMVMAMRSDWLRDYASNMRCCTDIPESLCDPADPLANSACRDVCHYGSCSKGGQCELRSSGPGFRRVCHCNCYEIEESKRGPAGKRCLL